MRRTRSIQILATLLPVLLLAASCSSGSGESSAATAAEDEETTETTETTAAGITATGEPIVIGFMNNEGGAFSVPELRVGNEVATDYVNERLGGVNGRPFKVERCATDGTPESAIDCVNQFIERGVVAVLEGTDLGADAGLPLLKDAGIPMLGHVQFGAGRMFDANAFYFGAAAIAYGVAALRYYADEGVDTIAWFLPDEATSHAFTDGFLLPAAEAIGVKYKTVYYDAANPNWAVLAATAVSEGVDASGSVAATDAQCAEMVSALRDAGYQGRVFAASCFNLVRDIGDKAIGVDTDADHWITSDIESAPAAKQDQLREYVRVMEDAGHRDLVHGNALITFADMLTLRDVLSTIEGDIDGAAVTSALMATKDLDSFVGPSITCDHSVMAGNSACHAGLLFFQVQDDLTIKTMTPDFVLGVI
ncbi:MAG TPA: ABC transporter substrate-binding protein [Acidimicrobiales bacterium]|nr:ABC transporter substrate-binding protein [Acidimicrobiales bacterium]